MIQTGPVLREYLKARMRAQDGIGWDAQERLNDVTEQRYGTGAGIEEL